MDDDRSIVYQVRRDADEPVIKEGLRRATDDLEYGHCGAFGVPKGAGWGAARGAGECFFRPVAGEHPETGRPNDTPSGRRVVQFKSNDSRDDIEVLQPVRAVVHSRI